MEIPFKVEGNVDVILHVTLFGVHSVGERFNRQPFHWNKTLRKK